MGAPPTPQKRAANSDRPSVSRKRRHSEIAQDNNKQSKSAPRKKKALSSDKSQESPTEKRPRRWRTRAPQAYNERLERAMNQRMFVLGRERNHSDSAPCEEIVIAGTTGNLYTVTISPVPSCTCPDAVKGNQCKHIIYALNRVLKAPAELRYQLSFLATELVAIFAASPLPKDTVSDADADVEHPSNRKPISGDCPICFCDMDDEEPADLVWCKVACGNNLHKMCFDQWAKSSKASSGKVRCVYCRADWNYGGRKPDGDTWNGTPEELAAMKANAPTSTDGYANIASELGLTGMRDYSSYHQPWVSRRSYGR